MYMVDHLKPEVRQHQLVTMRYQRKDIWVRVADRIDGYPALADDMAGSEARRRKAGQTCLSQEPSFPLRLASAVGVDGITKQIVLQLSLQRLDELLRAR
jgi:hypothetical protein